MSEILQAQALPSRRKLVLTLVQFTTCLGILSVAPLFHVQPVTGPIVNAVLFAAVVLLGTQTTLVMCLLPSVIALSVGLLPAVLAPMIPFIMISNVILVVTFGFLRNKNYWLSIGVASFLKFIFLFSTSSIVIKLLLKKEVASSVVAIMSWPQLATALAGGVLAFVFLKSIKKI